MLIGGLVPAIIPVVVITGIMLGVMTPTESGAVASIIALALGFIYREIMLRDLGKILFDVATNTATITGLIAAASVLSWVLAFQGVPDAVVEVMKGLTDSPFVFLLLVIVMLLVLGMFLESISVLIVVVPLLMPVVATLGIDPIHFGVVCTVATVIGPHGATIPRHHPLPGHGAGGAGGDCRGAGALDLAARCDGRRLTGGIRNSSSR